MLSLSLSPALGTRPSCIPRRYEEDIATLEDRSPPPVLVFDSSPSSTPPNTVHGPASPRMRSPPQLSTPTIDKPAVQRPRLSPVALDGDRLVGTSTSIRSRVIDKNELGPRTTTKTLAPVARALPVTLPAKDQRSAAPTPVLLSPTSPVIIGNSPPATYDVIGPVVLIKQQPPSTRRTPRIPAPVSTTVNKPIATTSVKPVSKPVVKGTAKPAKPVTMPRHRVFTAAEKVVILRQLDEREELLPAVLERITRLEQESDEVRARNDACDISPIGARHVFDDALDGSEGSKTSPPPSPVPGPQPGWTLIPLKTGIVPLAAVFYQRDSPEPDMEQSRRDCLAWLTGLPDEWSADPLCS